MNLPGPIDNSIVYELIGVTLHYENAKALRHMSTDTDTAL